MNTVGRETCLRCGGTMERLGSESLQLGQYGFFTGHWSNLLSGALEVDIYRCAKCGKIEFYEFDPDKSADGGLFSESAPPRGDIREY